MELKNIVIAGGGVLGSQIAYQTAYKGFNLTIWLRSEASIDRAKPKIEELHKVYLQALESLKNDNSKNISKFGGLVDNKTSITNQEIDDLKKQADEAFKNIKYTTDLNDAVKDSDILIETIAEDPKMKVEFYTKLAKVLPEKTILATNSSSMVPSNFAQYTGRPEKYLSLHFLNQIWENNIAEIMGHDGTSTEAYNTIVEFATKIGMIPLQLKKEQPGYIFNSMLIPLLNSAQALWANGVADPKTIDMTWVKATGSKLGPFQILDIVGLVTAYNIVKMSPEASDPNSMPGKICANLKSFIDEGKTGIGAGEGFYNYKK